MYEYTIRKIILGIDNTVSTRTVVHVQSYTYIISKLYTVAGIGKAALSLYWGAFLVDQTLQ